MNIACAPIPPKKTPKLLAFAMIISPLIQPMAIRKNPTKRADQAPAISTAVIRSVSRGCSGVTHRYRAI